MTARNITPPYPVFLDRDGTPLDNGFVFIGVENLEPVTNPLPVYWDEDLLIPADQPIRTINGYPSRSGTPSQVYTNSNYSITVRDKKGLIVYSEPSVSNSATDLAAPDGSSRVGFIQAGIGATPRTVQDKEREQFSFTDFAGVDITGNTDSTAGMQAALDALPEGGTIHAPRGIYKFTSLKVSKPITVVGVGNKNMTNIFPAGGAGVGLVLSDLPVSTIFYGTSLTLPAINLDLGNAVKSGLKIEGLVFWQDHADYANPTDYPYVISDENTNPGYYWSGLQIKDCLFANSNKGISLTRSERFDITDIHGEFFRVGVNASTIKDASRIERFHSWTFAKSTAGDTFRQGASSDYLIKIVDADALILNDIFAWDRYKGIYLERVWCQGTGYVADIVGYALTIKDPKNFNFSLRDIQVNSSNIVGTIDAAIKIEGVIATGSASCMLSDVTVWSSGHANAFDTGILVDNAFVKLTLNNIIAKYANKDAIKILAAKTVIIDDVLFAPGFGNFTATYPNTVGIRNESTTAVIQIGNVISEDAAIAYLFDGYSDRVNFHVRPSLISTKPHLLNGAGATQASSTASGRRITTATGVANTGAFNGLRVAGCWADKTLQPTNLVCGVYYKVTTIIATTGQTISFNRPGAEEIAIGLNPAVGTATRLTVRWFSSAGGTMTVGPLYLDFTGVFEYYGQFMCMGRSLVIGAEPPGAMVAAAPTVGYWFIGDRYPNAAPAVGQPKAWSCTVTGAPGTWVSEGNL